MKKMLFCLAFLISATTLSAQCESNAHYIEKILDKEEWCREIIAKMREEVKKMHPSFARSKRIQAIEYYQGQMHAYRDCRKMLEE